MSTDNRPFLSEDALEEIDKIFKNNKRKNMNPKKEKELIEKKIKIIKEIVNPFVYEANGKQYFGKGDLRIEGVILHIEGVLNKYLQIDTSPNNPKS
jgi:hypothetical protein